MHRHRWPYAVAAGVVVFLVLTLRPVHTLKTNPPEKFFEASIGNEIDDKETWARAYWAVARNIRWKFQYGETLPDQVPSEFRVAAEESLPASVAAHVRLAYWYQLRTVWTTSEAWSTTYKLDFTWIPALIDAVVGKVVDIFKDVWRGIF